MITSTEMCHRANITYRQLDHWLRLGILEAADGRAEPGSGHPRTFTDREAALASAVGDLAALGMSLTACRHLATQLRNEVLEWEGHAFVDVDGGLARGQLLGTACYVLDLGELTRGLAHAVASR